VLIAQGAKGPFVLVWGARGAVLLRENGPLAGRGLAKARLIGYDTAGQEQSVSSRAGPRELSFQPIDGVERYELVYR
jgi:hypothetical protein